MMAVLVSSLFMAPNVVSGQNISTFNPGEPTTLETIFCLDPWNLADILTTNANEGFDAMEEILSFYQSTPTPEGLRPCTLERLTFIPKSLYAEVQGVHEPGTDTTETFYIIEVDVPGIGTSYGAFAFVDVSP